MSQVVLTLPQTVASGRELDAEFQAVFAAFVGDKETEENWEQRDKAIQRVVCVQRIGGHEL